MPSGVPTSAGSLAGFTIDDFQTVNVSANHRPGNRRRYRRRPVTYDRVFLNRPIAMLSDIERLHIRGQDFIQNLNNRKVSIDLDNRTLCCYSLLHRYPFRHCLLRGRPYHCIQGKGCRDGHFCCLNISRICSRRFALRRYAICIDRCRADGKTECFGQRFARRRDFG